MQSDSAEMRDNEVFEFRVQGELDAGWSEWFEGFEIAAADGETILSGRVRDQAALYGFIGKLRNLGLVLLSVNRAESDEPMRLLE